MAYKIQTITLGGGCFWCTEAIFDRVRGVTGVESGYTNGQTIHPNYEDVCRGDTGHAEVVRLSFDADEISLVEILGIFFHTHDPTTLNRQGNDMGTQYRSGIYYEDPEHGRIASDMVRQMSQDKQFGAPIITEVKPLQNYSAAEAYHQNYFANNPRAGYCAYVVGPKVQKFRKSFEQYLKM